MNNNEQIKPIEEEPKKEIKNNVKLNIKENPTKIIEKLPEWSIEPPLEINRGK
jgi:hypothetical protein